MSLSLAVEIHNLYKTYKLGSIEVEVLKGINLSVEKGEFVSIMGPSGSGKSTLLYLIGGLDKPSSGSIKVNGRELSNMTDRIESLMREEK